jgi:hypothetical protein
MHGSMNAKFKSFLPRVSVCNYKNYSLRDYRITTEFNYYTLYTTQIKAGYHLVLYRES